MNFRYEDHLPHPPKDIIEEIYRLVENPIDNHHSSDEVYKYIESKISSDPDLQLNSINKELLHKLQGFTYDINDSLGPPMDQAGKYFKDLATFDFLPASDMIIKWVHKNISPQPIYVSIQVMFGGSTVTPHVDEGRTSVYNYILDTGGGITKFYKNAKGYEHLIAYPQTIFPYDRIEEVESIDIEKNRWHSLNVTKIHNVENILPGQKRISLSLSYV